MLVRARRALVCSAMIAVVILGGCTGDETGNDMDSEISNLLLTEQDVPGGTSSSDLEELPGYTICGPLGRAENRLPAVASDDSGFAVREIVAETSVGETSVVAAAFGGVSEFEQGMIFDQLGTGLQACTRDSPLQRGDQLAESIDRLDRLPDGAVGYSSEITDGGVTEVVERIYAPVGSTVLVVGSRHVGGDETGIDIRQLLQAMIARAEAASRTP